MSKEREIDTPLNLRDWLSAYLVNADCASESRAEVLEEAINVSRNTRHKRMLEEAMRAKTAKRNPHEN